jgi:hypothetical protein
VYEKVYIISYTSLNEKSMQSIANKVINRIYGHGRGWAFIPKDFTDLGKRPAIDVSLNRLIKKGTIRRIMRGI